MAGLLCHWWNQVRQICFSSVLNWLVRHAVCLTDDGRGERDSFHKPPPSPICSSPYRWSSSILTSQFLSPPQFPEGKRVWLEEARGRHRAAHRRAAWPLPAVWLASSEPSSSSAPSSPSFLACMCECEHVCINVRVHLCVHVFIYVCINVHIPSTHYLPLYTHFCPTHNHTHFCPTHEPHPFVLSMWCAVFVLFSRTPPPSLPY